MMRAGVIPSAARNLAFLAALLAPALTAHPLAPALLELQETAPARYAVHWRTSVVRTAQQAVEPQLPASCARLSEPQPRVVEGEAVVARWLVQCAAPLATVTVTGLEASGINVVVRVLPVAGPEFRALLGPDQPAIAIAPRESVFGRYLRLGVEHLFTGLDHLLFLLGLFLLVPTLRSLVATVTAFTVGHCLTLGLATVGLITVRQAPAELAIAATVLLLALALTRKGSESFAQMTPTPFLAAGVFGLIHGLGFAGALRDIGLPRADIPWSLLAFNVGIEVGQLALVLVLLVLAALWRRLPAAGRMAPAAVRLAPAYLIGSLAAFWCLERSAALFG